MNMWIFMCSSGDGASDSTTLRNNRNDGMKGLCYVENYGIGCYILFLKETVIFEKCLTSRLPLGHFGPK